ncbi:MAG: YceI family protein [Bernardetiaceae bacterium]
MSVATQQQWIIDPTHSEVYFKVKHMMVSTVTGSFASFEGSLSADGEGFEGASVSFSAEVASLYTNNAQRDEHLKSADFFDAANHPQLSFASTAFKATGEDTYTLSGILSIRGIEKPVSLNVVHHGTAVDPYGQTKAGFEITGTILRKDFGLAWDAVTEAGNVVVSNEVRLSLNVQLTKQV